MAVARSIGGSPALVGKRPIGVQARETATREPTIYILEGTTSADATQSITIPYYSRVEVDLIGPGGPGANSAIGTAGTAGNATTFATCSAGAGQPAQSGADGGANGAGGTAAGPTGATLTNGTSGSAVGPMGGAIGAGGKAISSGGAGGTGARVRHTFRPGDLAVAATYTLTAGKLGAATSTAAPGGSSYARLVVYY